VPKEEQLKRNKVVKGGGCTCAAFFKVFQTLKVSAQTLCCLLCGATF